MTAAKRVMVPAEKRDALIKRILAKTKRTSNGCLEWQGVVVGVYPLISFKNKTYTGSRLLWAAYYGETPSELIVCHECDNPLCLNIKHLWLGTYKDNIRDSVQKRRNVNIRKTHCSQGHPLSGDNLLIVIKPNGSIARRCRICQVENSRRFRKSKRGDRQYLDRLNASARARYHTRKQQVEPQRVNGAPPEAAPPVEKRAARDYSSIRSVTRKE